MSYADMLERARALNRMSKITTDQIVTDATPEDVNDLAPLIADWTPGDNKNESLYQVGDVVRHNGQTWKSTAANNHWEPGAYGWVVVV